MYMCKSVEKPWERPDSTGRPSSLLAYENSTATTERIITVNCKMYDDAFILLPW